MSLEKSIAAARFAAHPFSTAILDGSQLSEWQAAARKLERDSLYGWRSYYVACAVVGTLLATLAWQRLRWHPQCGAAAPANVMQLDPATVRARGGEVYEL